MSYSNNGAAIVPRARAQTEPIMFIGTSRFAALLGVLRGFVKRRIDGYRLQRVLQAFAIVALLAAKACAQLDTEPANNSPLTADMLALPAPGSAVLNTTTLGGFGNDVDFFQTSLATGDVWFGMTTPIARLPTYFAVPDTMIGVFDGATPQTFSDDDLASVLPHSDFRRGSLFRFESPATQTYQLGVTGFEDYEFDGAASGDPHVATGAYLLTAGRVNAAVSGGGFADTDPDNQTPAGANLISLSGDSAKVGVAHLSPNDIDFFRLSLKAGDVLSAMTASLADPGVSFDIPDTRLGLFGATSANVFMFNEDAGDVGGSPLDPNLASDMPFDDGIFASAIRARIPVDGIYHLAVTGFGDDDFDGAHREEGAYALLVGLASSGPVVSDIHTWTGGAGVWSDTTRWDAAGAPAANWMARITGAASDAVNVNGDSTVRDVAIGGGASTASLNMTSGTLTATDKVTVSNGGTLNLDGGTLSTPSIVNDAAFLVTQGQHTLGDLLGTGDLTVAAGAGLTIDAMRQDQVTVQGRVNIRASSGVSVLNGLTLGEPAPAEPVGKFDLNDTAAIVDYVNASPLTEVRRQILAGRGGAGLGAPWTGPGITSSAVAAANATQPESASLGFADNGELPLGPFTTFRGLPVDETSILISYTRTGDATLDGVVNDDDVTVVGATYAPGVANANWAGGDFDYNGFVDDDDVTLLGVFYDPDAPAIGAAPTDVAGAVAAVPEPGVIALLFTGVVVATLGAIVGRLSVAKSAVTLQV